MNKEIEDMSNPELRDHFIKKTNELKKGFGLTFTKIAEILQRKHEPLGLKRMKNIRSTKPPHVYPTVFEINLLLQEFADRFQTLNAKSGLQAEQERNVTTLEKRIEELEDWKELILKKINRLELELDRVKKGTQG
ncbi:MAG: hypothetical protein HRU41_31030 [Saprospiraceae bacterium]|nr:hypothetical protein [Saprospiraceae bacterium]